MLFVLKTIIKLTICLAIPFIVFGIGAYSTHLATKDTLGAIVIFSLIGNICMYFTIRNQKKLISCILYFLIKAKINVNTDAGWDITRKVFKSERPNLPMLEEISKKMAALKYDDEN